MHKLIQKIIELAFILKIMGTNFKSPITFKSGIRSPIYFDWRKVSSSIELRNLITQALKEKVKDWKCTVVLGVAMGGIPPSERLADALGLPSAYIRPDAKNKGYGMGNVIEGASIAGEDVLIVEDLYSTGGSALANRKIALEHGAKSVKMISIFSYNMDRMKKEFAEAGVEPESLIIVDDVLPFMDSKLNDDEYEMLMDWVNDPEGWFERHKLQLEFGYVTNLRKSAFSSKSLICLGADPVIEALPLDYAKHGISGFNHYLNDLLEEMERHGIAPAAIKPNESCYMVHNRPLKNDFTGYESLGKVITTCDSMGIPSILDCKRGDIGNTSALYAKGYFEGWNPDALTVHCYMGDDSVLPFAEYCNTEKKKGIYVLDLTSNKGSENFQKKRMSSGKFLYEEVTDKIIEWATKRPGLGAVIGATHEQLFPILKSLAGKGIPGLIPGVGSQGASARYVVEVAQKAGYELDLLRINSSSGLTHPWYKKPGDKIPTAQEAIETCVSEFQKLNEEVGYMVEA